MDDLVTIQHARPFFRNLGAFPDTLLVTVILVAPWHGLSPRHCP